MRLSEARKGTVQGRGQARQDWARTEEQKGARGVGKRPEPVKLPVEHHQELPLLVEDLCDAVGIAMPGIGLIVHVPAFVGVAHSHRVQKVARTTLGSSLEQKERDRERERVNAESKLQLLVLICPT